ncbi:hypothetical protein MIDIC_110085 [Alphaproteobacteria bacterium]
MHFIGISESLMLNSQNSDSMLCKHKGDASPHSSVILILTICAVKATVNPDKFLKNLLF